jgi:hypothetical protein
MGKKSTRASDATNEARDRRSGRVSLRRQSGERRTGSTRRGPNQPKPGESPQLLSPQVSSTEDTARDEWCADKSTPQTLDALPGTVDADGDGQGQQQPPTEEGECGGDVLKQLQGELFANRLGALRCAKAVVEFARAVGKILQQTLIAMEPDAWERWITTQLGMSVAEALAYMLFTDAPGIAEVDVSAARAISPGEAFRLVGILVDEFRNGQAAAPVAPLVGRPAAADSVDVVPAEE